MQKVNILGINVHKTNKNEVLKKIEEYIANGQKCRIVTPNPEIILHAQYDEEYSYILNDANISLPDGIGLKFAVWLMGENINRVTGADLIDNLLELAKKRKEKVLILNWRRGFSKRGDIEKALNNKYPNLNFLVFDIDREGKLINLNEINNFKPVYIFCTLGAPFQDKIIYYNLPEIPSTKLGIGIGGSIDFLTKKKTRAPKLLRILGLEWIWRLIRQPNRWKRIYNAIFVFSYHVFIWRFIHPFLYRPNVACLLYKKEGNNHKILLVERKEERGHWQIPQGGTDGEDIEMAGKRELSEEINCAKFKIEALHKNVNKYSFNRDLGKFNIDTRGRLGYKGQKQSLVIAKFLGDDKDIKINFYEHTDWKWVDSKNFINELHELRKEAGKIYYEKFNELIYEN